MATFIYFGKRFSAAQTEGYFGSYTCVDTELGVEWDAIQSALDRGERVEILQPTAAQIGPSEALLEMYKRLGGPATMQAALREQQQ